MHILMIHPHDIYSPVEPWTRRVKSLAKEFVKHGHQVKLVYFPLPNTDNKNLEQLADYEIIALNRDQSPVTFIKNIIEITKLAEWADIIHFQKCQHYAAIPSLIAAYIKRKPLHYDWDDWEEQIWYESCGRNIHSDFIGLFFKVLERFLPVLSDTVSVPSHYLKYLALKFGVREKDICIAPVGADVKEFNLELDGSEIRKKYKIDCPLVLYIGQLHGAQYIDLFLRAANIILHKDPCVAFMIVGEGFMGRALKELVFELGITNRVIFTGSVPHDKVPHYIAAADICVAPFKDTKVTRCKSPLKIVEYMAMGKAIVASNVGEVKSMLGGVGILVEAGNFHSLADGILKLLKDDNLRKKLGIFSRKRAESQYNWQKTAASLLTTYSRSLS